MARMNSSAIQVAVRSTENAPLTPARQASTNSTPQTRLMGMFATRNGSGTSTSDTRSSLRRSSSGSNNDDTPIIDLLTLPVFARLHAYRAANAGTMQSMLNTEQNYRIGAVGRYPIISPSQQQHPLERAGDRRPALTESNLNRHRETGDNARELIEDSPRIQRWADRSAAVQVRQAQIPKLAAPFVQKRLGRNYMLDDLPKKDAAEVASIQAVQKSSPKTSERVWWSSSNGRTTPPTRSSGPGIALTTAAEADDEWGEEVLQKLGSIVDSAASS